MIYDLYDDDHNRSCGSLAASHRPQAVRPARPLQPCHRSLAAATGHRPLAAATGTPFGAGTTWIGETDLRCLSIATPDGFPMMAVPVTWSA